MDNEFKTPNFASRVKSLIKLDFYRLFHTSLLYIMIVVSALIPALVLTMTNSAESTMEITNVWQVIELVSGGNSGMGIMDMATLCNINMVFIFVAIFVSIFISHDYSSGYIKNIFTVHSKKGDYVISKTIAGIFGGACMIVAYVLGAIIAGLLAGKSFVIGSVIGLLLCILSKIFLMSVFVPLYVMVAVFFKQKLWLSIIGAFALGVLFYPIAMMVAPLNAGILNVILCLAGGAMLGAVFGLLSNLILNKRDLA